MKLDRIRVFNSSEAPCQKFYFRDGKLKKQKDVVLICLVIQVLETLL